MRDSQSRRLGILFALLIAGRRRPELRPAKRATTARGPNPKRAIAARGPNRANHGDTLSCIPFPQYCRVERGDDPWRRAELRVSAGADSRSTVRGHRQRYRRGIRQCPLSRCHRPFRPGRRGALWLASAGVAEHDTAAQRVGCTDLRGVLSSGSGGERVPPQGTAAPRAAGILQCTGSVFTPRGHSAMDGQSAVRSGPLPGRSHTTRGSSKQRRARLCTARCTSSGGTCSPTTNRESRRLRRSSVFSRPRGAPRCSPYG